MTQEKKRRHRRKHPELNRNCYNCNHCQYIGEGDYICDMSNDIVIADWQPSEDYNSCKGKEFENI